MMHLYISDPDLIAGMGNYGDSIRNLVREFQKYVDSLYLYIPTIYTEVSSKKSEYLDLFTFLFGENESIMIQKGIVFAIDSYNIVDRKFESLRRYVKEHKENENYIIPTKVFSLVFKDQPFAEMVSSSFNIYAEKSIPDNEELYKFEQFMTYTCEEFGCIMDQYSKSLKKYNGEEFIKLLDESGKSFFDTMHKYKKLAERSTSVYITARIVRSIIVALVMSCLAFESIRAS